MASSSVPLPTSSWVILGAKPGVCAEEDAELPKGADFSLELAAPPLVSHLKIPRRIFKDDITDVNFPSVLVVNSSGLLLLHCTEGLSTGPLVVDEPEIKHYRRHAFLHAYYVCDAVSGTAFRLPTPPASPIVNAGNLGLITMPGDGGSYIVAELQPIIGSNLANFLVFYSGSSKWTEKRLEYPLQSATRPWGGHSVISHQGRFYWVDVSWGLLTYSLFDERSGLRFVPLPPGKMLPFSAQVDFEKTRCIKTSGRRIVFVEITEHAHSFRPALVIRRLKHLQMLRAHGVAYWVRMWILTDPEAGLWALEHKLCLDDICSGSGEAPRLTTKPRIACVHPVNPDIVFFFIGENLVSINLRNKRLEKWGKHKAFGLRKGRRLSSWLLHAWELPRTLFSGSAKETVDGVNEDLHQLVL